MTGKESQGTVKIAGKGITREVTINGKLLSPVRSQKLINGYRFFAWGNGATQDSLKQLALAILLECTSSYAIAIRFYKSFACKVVFGFEEPDFEIEIDITDWVQRENIWAGVL